VRVFINKSTVPRKHRKDPRILGLEADLRDQFCDAQHRREVCIHEAAHEIYMRRAGFGVIRKGPSIQWCPESRRVFTSGACVQIQITRETRKADGRLETVAKFMAAGGVAASSLCSKVGNFGDEEDFLRFVQFCANEFSKKEIQLIWNQAKKLVRQDLRNMAFRKEVLEVARDFENEVFGEIPADNKKDPDTTRNMVLALKRVAKHGTHRCDRIRARKKLVELQKAMAA
jgi:hypothetical protein